MSSLLLPRRFYNQPQGAVQLNSIISRPAGIYITQDNGVLHVGGRMTIGADVVPAQHGIRTSLAVHNVSVAVPGQDVGVVWFAHMALDNLSATFDVEQLNGYENYGSQFSTRLGTADYSTNNVRGSFKYSSFGANTTAKIALPASARECVMSMYADKNIVEFYLNGHVVYSQTQNATLPTSAYVFTGTSTSGQHITRYGRHAAGQQKGAYCAGSFFSDDRSLAQSLSDNPYQIFRVSE